MSTQRHDAETILRSWSAVRAVKRSSNGNVMAETFETPDESLAWQDDSAVDVRVESCGDGNVTIHQQTSWGISRNLYRAS